MPQPNIASTNAARTTRRPGNSGATRRRSTRCPCPAIGAACRAARQRWFGRRRTVDLAARITCWGRDVAAQRWRSARALVEQLDGAARADAGIEPRHDGGDRDALVGENVVATQLVE